MTASSHRTPPFVAVAGPTGSGKSQLAVALAERLGGEVVSCDSLQLYQGFDIGTAKPAGAVRQAIPHHLIDCLQWQDDWDAARYRARAREIILDIARRGAVPIVAGGTGLYLRALIGDRFDLLPSDAGLRQQIASADQATLYRRLRQLDPERARVVHPHDRVRVVRALEVIALTGRPMSGRDRAGSPDFPPACTVRIAPPRAKLHRAIEERAAAMIEAGLMDEVQDLLARGCPEAAKPMRSIGYRQAVEVLAGERPREELLFRIVAATRQYAKRQETWFRKIDAQVVLPSPVLTDEVVAHIQQSLSAARRLRRPS